MNAQDVVHAKNILKGIGNNGKFKFWPWVRQQIEVRGYRHGGVVERHLIIVSTQELEALQHCVNFYKHENMTERQIEVWKLAASAVDKISREFYVPPRYNWY
jgi:hypothetical protein